jgi:hypothetical protein
MVDVMGDCPAFVRDHSCGERLDQAKMRRVGWLLRSLLGPSLPGGKGCLLSDNCTSRPENVVDAGQLPRLAIGSAASCRAGARPPGMSSRRLSGSA